MNPQEQDEKHRVAQSRASRYDQEEAMKTHWLKCERCGAVDTDTYHAGTAVEMLCRDCADPCRTASSVTGYATLCRKCCPTGHGTHGEKVKPRLNKRVEPEVWGDADVARSDDR